MAERSQRRRRTRRDRPPDIRLWGQPVARVWAILLALLVGGSVLAIGAVHVPVILVVAAVAIVAGVLGWRAGRSEWHGWLSLPALAFLALAVWTLIQAIPLPMSWLAAISPETADVWSRALRPFGDVPPGPEWAPISLAPGATYVEALKWLAYFAVFGLAVRLAISKGVQWGILVVFGSAVTVALVTLVHGLVGAETVYGIYEPRFASVRWGLGPLLNPNNLAGYLNLGALCGFGLLDTSRPKLPRWLTGIGIMLLVAASIISASRGGVIALGLGLLVFALLSARRWRKGAGHPKARWAAAASVIGGIVLAVLGAPRGTWEQVLDENLGKLNLVTWTRDMVADYPWFGVGRGATEGAFAAYRQDPGHKVYTHIENFIGQWIAEWGIPVAIIALAIFIYSFRPKRLQARRTGTTCGAYAALATVVIQNFFDLGFELLGVGIAVVALLGTLYGGAQSNAAESSDTAKPAPLPTPAPELARWRRTVPAVLFTSAAVVALVGTVALGWRDALTARDELTAEFRETNFARDSEVQDFMRSLREAIVRHPADPHFATLGGLASYAVGKNPMPWIQSAIKSDPFASRAHLLLASVLRARGANSQALFELRLAYQSDPSLRGRAVRTAAQWTDDADRLERWVPAGAEGGSMLTTLAAHYHPVEQLGIRKELLRRALLRNAWHISARVLDGRDLINALVQPERYGRCAGSRQQACEERVREHIAVIKKRDPDNLAALELQARLLAWKQGPELAAELLAESCAERFVEEACFRLWARFAAQARDYEQLQTAVTGLLRHACFDTERCARAARLAGDLAFGHGAPGMAAEFYQRAARQSPSAEHWLKVARAASKAQMHTKALAALQKAKPLATEQRPEIEKMIEAERRAAAGLLLERPTLNTP